ncbi:hypothetical protein CH275_05090 [Rhodococcus sp. 06-235-1A]|uniref:hypothetical protein n=1 Tax=Rhodococcus sp. 06-235-1A TaxID=2022508 RepID=UPI000B9BF64D|nr:hypothetical protein [Rhodococcus sp. 06-235-1A]OZD07948.1 hypothetical protein CH275_05090 [Rhodococcus sp. 06-235-1A]
MTSRLPDVFSPSAVQYGETVRVDDRTTVLPVSRRSARGAETAVGLFTITDGTATWTPAVDMGRIHLIGALTGLIAATLGCAAVVRRPPWPNVTIDR